MTFSELIKNPKLTKAIEQKGYTEPTEIQEKAIPVILQKKDLIGQSQTGTGKTAAFALPTLEGVDPQSEDVAILVVTPTRELAVQVAGEYKELAQYERDIRVVAVYGGEPIYRQIKLLKRRPQVIVGTPGRLMDHMRRKTIRLDHLQVVILDEADEMLSMGFREDIETILEDAPKETQKLLFSATMPKAIRKLADTYLKDPTNIEIESDSVATDTIKQQFVAIKKTFKRDVLFRLLERKQPERCLIFCNTKRIVDETISVLQDHGFMADKIHGDMKQEQRMMVLDQFNRGSISVLVATDVAARGLDIQNVDLVINYDLPEDEAYYVHRIGRSGRAGTAGESISILTSRDRMRLERIEKYMDKRVELIQVPSVKKLNKIKLNRYVEELIEEAKNPRAQVLEDVLKRLDYEGISPELALSVLIEKNLSFEHKNDKDLNDPHFFSGKKSKGNSKKNYNKKKSYRRRKRK